MLLAHGWGANYGNLLQLAEPLLRQGYPVLLFDVRGHGRNAEVPYATVRDFRDDVLAVAGWAGERFAAHRRVLVGHSMGGAAAVLATAAGAPVDALALVAGPADVLDVTSAYLTDKGLPGGLMVVALRPFWWWRLRSSFRDLVPERKIRGLELPILILQPEDDNRVHRDHAERLAASADRPYHVVADTGHNTILGSPGTHRLLLEFLAET